MFNSFRRNIKSTQFKDTFLLFGSFLGVGTLTFANEGNIEPLDYGWNHHGALGGFDRKAVRRGFQVYREVCASCHSLNRIAFRHFVNEFMDEKDAKELAESYDIQNEEPNDEGEMFERPGKLTDYMPAPYPNDQAARAANNGALPPDLSLICKARHGGIDYLYALLTGYMDPPEGKSILPGLYYNPYFPGGAIGMERQLQDGQIEYEDGTPCTTAQMAKDVSIFLHWCAYPEYDERKKLGFQVLIALGVMTLLTFYWKRVRWSTYKSQKITYV